MRLTNTKVKNAKPRGKTYKLFDGEGLYIEVSPRNSKYWRMKYRYGGREKRLAIGVYPEISLKEARDKKILARRLLDEGIDPSLDKRARKQRAVKNTQNSFEDLARAWHKNWKQNKSERHALTTIHRLEKDVFPHIGHMPVNQITPQMILSVAKKIEERKAYDVARRVKTACGQIFRYGVGCGRAERDVTYDLKDAMRPYKPEHYPTLEIEELPDFLDTLDSREIGLHPQTRTAMKFMLLTFVRTSELIKAEWSEINCKEALWIIPAHKMKMRRDHIVPLSKQALEILDYQKSVNGYRQWVFASYSHPKKHMSAGTLSGAIKNMGYRGRMTGHGFRALAMTTIKERLHVPHEVIDRQLAHAQSKIAAPYDRAKFLKRRIKMMQEWADYTEEVYGRKIYRNPLLQD